MLSHSRAEKAGSSRQWISPSTESSLSSLRFVKPQKSGGTAGGYRSPDRDLMAGEPFLKWFSGKLSE